MAQKVTTAASAGEALMEMGLAGEVGRVMGWQVVEGEAMGAKVMGAAERIATRTRRTQAHSLSPTNLQIRPRARPALAEAARRMAEAGAADEKCR